MDVSAVLILCLLIAQAYCGAIRNERKSRALNSTIQDVLKDLQTAQKHLVDLGLSPNMSCPQLNTTELGQPEQENITFRQLSFFRCYMLNASEPSNELTRELKAIAQYISNIEELMDSSEQQDCKLPTSGPVTEHYIYISCLLQLLNQRFSKAPLNFTA